MGDHPLSERRKRLVLIELLDVGEIADIVGGHRRIGLFVGGKEHVAVVRQPGVMGETEGRVLGGQQGGICLVAHIVNGKTAEIEFRAVHAVIAHIHIVRVDIRSGRDEYRFSRRREHVDIQHASVVYIATGQVGITELVDVDVVTGFQRAHARQIGRPVLVVDRIGKAGKVDDQQPFRSSVLIGGHIGEIAPGLDVAPGRTLAGNKGHFFCVGRIGEADDRYAVIQTDQSVLSAVGGYPTPNVVEFGIVVDLRQQRHVQLCEGKCGRADDREEYQQKPIHSSISLMDEAPVIWGTQSPVQRMGWQK